MANQNMTMNLGYKGGGVVNGIPAYNDQGAYLLGGIAMTAVVAGSLPYFGRVASCNPAATQDGCFYTGIPSGYYPLGIILYSAGIAMNNPSRFDSYLETAPSTIMNKGQVWLHTWGLTQPGAIIPKVGCVVICELTTGLIEFQEVGCTTPSSLWVVLSGVKVVSVSNDTSGAMLFVNF
jgi:hypothetical protein